MNDNDGFATPASDALDVDVIEQILMNHEQSPEIAKRLLDMTSAQLHVATFLTGRAGGPPTRKE
jgi:hypothetical protein